MATYKKVTELIGKTPLLELTNYEAKWKYRYRTCISSSI